MHHQERPTATYAEIDAANRQLGARQWLDWAVAFAQESLDTARPGRKTDLRLELAGFLREFGPGISGNSEAMELATDDELRTLQSAFIRIIQHILRGEPIALGLYPLEVSVIIKDDMPQIAEWLTVIDQLEVAQAEYALARAFEGVRREFQRAGHTGPFLKVCPAPQPRRNNPCGRWFVGPPKRIYCSASCQNLAGTRTLRTRRKAAIAS